MIIFKNFCGMLHHFNINFKKMLRHFVKVYSLNIFLNLNYVNSLYYFTRQKMNIHQQNQKNWNKMRLCINIKEKKELLQNQDRVIKNQVKRKLYDFILKNTF